MFKVYEDVGENAKFWNVLSRSIHSGIKQHTDIAPVEITENWLYAESSYFKITVSEIDTRLDVDIMGVVKSMSEFYSFCHRIKHSFGGLVDNVEIKYAKGNGTDVVARCGFKVERNDIYKVTSPTSVLLEQLIGARDALYSRPDQADSALKMTISIKNHLAETMFTLTDDRNA